MSASAFLREMLLLWPAWQTIVDYVTVDGDPRTVDPHRVFGAACGTDLDRLAALLYGHHVGDSMEEAAGVLDEILVMARNGRRPRFGVEMGLRPEDFGRAA